MNIQITNPKEDKYGNSKENIFLAFDDEDNYLGSAYAYPAVNHHQTYETPYIIFIGINIDDNVNKSLYEEAKQMLFDKVFSRARELRTQMPELKARIYAGFEYNVEEFAFYIKNGFEEDFSIFMEADITDDFKYTLPESIKVEDIKLNSSREFEEYKVMYDEIFITPLDSEGYKELQREKHFKHVSFSIDGRQAGGCIIFEKDGLGYIETIYVLPEERGRGLSREIMNYIFSYFLSKGLSKTKLEVWELNKRAIELYRSFGYVETGKNLMFPGITL
jgi:GNAT superfamily N-acetyltransferase